MQERNVELTLLGQFEEPGFISHSPYSLLSRINLHKNWASTSRDTVRTTSKGCHLGTTFQASSWYLPKAPNPGREGLQISLPQRRASCSPTLQGSQTPGHMHTHNIWYCFLILDVYNKLGKVVLWICRQLWMGMLYEWLRCLIEIFP